MGIPVCEVIIMNLNQSEYFSIFDFFVLNLVINHLVHHTYFDKINTC